MARLGGDLALAPTAVYRAKAAVTRTRSLAWWLRSRRAPLRPGIRILFYHRVAHDGDELTVTPRRFAQHMGFLAAHGMRAVDVETVAADLDRGGEAAAGVVGLCFDDGYRDIAEHALPVLERLGFRATVFVATGVVDGSARFEWYERQPAVLSWAEISDLAGGEVVRFGAHTVTHPNLVALDDAAARAEVVDSKAALEARIGRPANAFCYPAGRFGARERRLVAEAGFSVATSCEPGTNVPTTDRLALYRLQVDPRDALLDVRAKLAGAHDKPLRLRTAWRRYGTGSVQRSSRSP
jgi:peptidoglycan/xylan/chitin deacetylase (PgdA/CDA1 family)